MEEFMGKNFLLENETAQILFHQHAARMPIVDYHCHINPQQIAENHVFKNITEAWLGGDHYKWRMIRSNGVEEKYITGTESTDREKFQKFAEALPRAIGNPLYHWTHMELQRYFNCSIPLNGETAEEIWNLCNKKLQEKEMSVLGIIKASNVKVICTTDDPADDLLWHKKIKEDGKCSAEVLPTMRPDGIMAIEKEGFISYLERLSTVSKIKIQTIKDVYQALENRIEFFHKMGCRVSDHGLDYVFFREVNDTELDKIFQKALHRENLTVEDIEAYKTGILLFLGQEYSKKNWGMQIHYSAQRNGNSLALKTLGADMGFDCIAAHHCGDAIVKLLDALNKKNKLPKTILYSLNPNDNALIGSIIGSFQGSEIAGKIQHGAAWWFNDSKTGMVDQLTSLASLSILGNFIGMLTDSRSFLSYTRHEYFRRILCNMIGTWVEKGEYPADMKILGNLVENISYHNAKNYFEF